MEEDYDILELRENKEGEINIVINKELLFHFDKNTTIGSIHTFICSHYSLQKEKQHYLIDRKLLTSVMKIGELYDLYGVDKKLFITMPNISRPPSS